MDFWLFALILVVVIVAFVALANSRTKGPTSPPPSAPSNPVMRSASDKSPETYRPSVAGTLHSPTTLQFRDKSQVSSPVSDLDVSDLVDALTGVPLHPELGLYQCNRCKAFYQPDSLEVIRKLNGGKCVSCGQVSIASVSEQREQRGRNADVGVVTLENYRQFVGRVVTFEGQVQDVLPSRRGFTYAVMFEKQRWVHGLKMVVFGNEMSRVGGAQFLLDLRGKVVRVRGLLMLHETYGYQIIVSDRAMILGIQ
jgi:hypothetical protein